EIVANTPEKVGTFMKKNNMTSLQMSSMISHLTRKGYINEKGILRRRVEITDKGRTIIKKYESLADNII
ncbi:MAG: winged helix-turn-helix domain-containing protein, partial [Thermoanaerobacteraceae bacterium]|nr:winged helix-turn-helix domain-containing protein [Thermoanaerobacteraceae bacterium]